MKVKELKELIKYVKGDKDIKVIACVGEDSEGKPFYEEIEPNYILEDSKFLKIVDVDAADMLLKNNENEFVGESKYF